MPIATAKATTRTFFIATSTEEKANKICGLIILFPVWCAASGVEAAEAESIHDILRRDKSIVYNTHGIMGMFLGIDQTRQFENKYKVKAPILRPILPKNWFLYAIYLIIVIAILIFLKVLLPT